MFATVTRVPLCPIRALPWLRGLRVEVPAMLFKIVAKEKGAQPRRPNEIFKILARKGL